MARKEFWNIVGWAIAGLLFGFAIVVMPAFAQGGPAVEPVCDARMIAEHAPSMTKDQYLEVVAVLEADGAIDREWADELRALIKEAYSTPDRDAWVRLRCAEKSTI